MVINNLKEIYLSSTSKGILYKFTGNVDGKKVFIKTGIKFKKRFSSLQPISEAIASKIISKFNIKCAINTLSKITLPNFNEEVLVNVSESFLDYDELLIGIRNVLGDTSVDNLYGKITTILPSLKADIDRMIAMDFLINNTDRHLKNFSVIVKNGDVVKLSPLYDNGSALYSDIQDFELEQDDKENWEKIDECKPFCKSHYRQLELIGDVKLTKVPLEELFNIVDKYKEYMSNYRVECIKHLLETRYNHLVERGILCD